MFGRPIPDTLSKQKKKKPPKLKHPFPDVMKKKNLQLKGFCIKGNPCYERDLYVPS